MSSPRPPSTSESNTLNDSSYHLGPSPGSFRLHATTQGGLRAIIWRRKDPQFGRDTEERLGVHAISGSDERGKNHAGRPFSTRRGNFRTRASRRRPARVPSAKDATRVGNPPPLPPCSKRATTFSASPSGRGRTGDDSGEGRRGGVPLLSLKQRRNTSHPRSQRRSRDSDGALRVGRGGAPSPPPDIFRCVKGECAPSFAGGVRWG
ncbi:hypothetical protein EV715DRAFT_278460 [Schizophyllum commune]